MLCYWQSGHDNLHSQRKTHCHHCHPAHNHLNSLRILSQIVHCHCHFGNSQQALALLLCLPAQADHCLYLADCCQLARANSKGLQKSGLGILELPQQTLPTIDTDRLCSDVNSDLCDTALWLSGIPCMSAIGQPFDAFRKKTYSFGIASCW